MGQVFFCKMPHGDFSDYGAFASLGFGLATMIAPETTWFTGIGPVKPFFDSAASPETLTVIRFVGGLFMYFAFTLFVVRWNTINGKAAAIGYTIAAINTVSIAYALDGGFVLRSWHLMAAIMMLIASHLAFNANPMLTSAMLAEKEKKKAAEQAAKTK